MSATGEPLSFAVSFAGLGSGWGHKYLASGDWAWDWAWDWG